MQVRIGGLLRCCLEELRLAGDIADEAPIGTIWTCRFCKERSLRKAADGIWEWNRPEGDM